MSFVKNVIWHSGLFRTYRSRLFVAFFITNYLTIGVLLSFIKDYEPSINIISVERPEPLPEIKLDSGPTPKTIKQPRKTKTSRSKTRVAEDLDSRQGILPTNNDSLAVQIADSASDMKKQYARIDSGQYKRDSTVLSTVALPSKKNKSPTNRKVSVSTAKIPGQANEKPVLIDKRTFNVSFREKKLKSVLNEIGNVTGLFFTYPENIIASVPLVTMEKKERTLDECISDALKGTGLNYWVSGRMVAVYQDLSSSSD